MRLHLYKRCNTPGTVAQLEFFRLFFFFFTKDTNRRNDLRANNVLAYEPYFARTCRQLINDNEVYVGLPLRYTRFSRVGQNDQIVIFHSNLEPRIS